MDNLFEVDYMFLEICDKKHEKKTIKTPDPVKEKSSFNTPYSGTEEQFLSYYVSFD